MTNSWPSRSASGGLKASIDVLQMSCGYVIHLLVGREERIGLNESQTLLELRNKRFHRLGEVLVPDIDLAIIQLL